MFKKYTIPILSILILTIFSSCGFIKMENSYADDQFTDFTVKHTYEESPDSAVYHGHGGHWGPCPAKPPVFYPEPVFPVTIYPPRTNSPEEVKPWPENSRKPANNKSPSRAGATLVQTPRHKRK